MPGCLLLEMMSVRRIIMSLSVAMTVMPYAAASRGIPSADTSAVMIDSSSVTAVRPLGDAGIFATSLDSMALKENISMSFADVLAYNSSVFIRQSGRASLSTISFRGTSASHTQVLWNGMEINSPMSGMTDFSLIPAFLTDRAELVHGSSSLRYAAGGIGGAVILGTGPDLKEGLSMQFIQGIGSFLTVDDYLRIGYRHKGFHASLRTVFSFSPGRFPYVNMDKKVNEYDDDMNIISSYHPREYNENGKYRDWHVLLETGYDIPAGGDIRLAVWRLGSYRQLPKLTVDYSGSGDFINEQDENTLRAVATYSKRAGDVNICASAGYELSGVSYDYAFDAGNGNWSSMTDSYSRTHAVHVKCNADWHLSDRWLLRSSLSVSRQMIESYDDVSGQGYDAGRTDAGLFVSLSWKPAERAGLTLAVREELAGDRLSYPIPSFNADMLVWRPAMLYLKCSVARNYRFPTMNDMYFIPGGNPGLRPENGFSYDAGYSLSKDWSGCSVAAEGTWFDSYINDWIIWLPYGNRKNFFTPLNLLQVHAYGVEQEVRFSAEFRKKWKFSLNGNFTWSPSRNMSGTGMKGDMSSGQQLVYIPEYCASVTSSLSFRSWRLLYKWCWYSRRYVMTSNEDAPSGSVPPYFMNDITLAKSLDFKVAEISLSLAVRNLFNENYVTVLSRPMPCINFEFFAGITPKWNRHGK